MKNQISILEEDTMAGIDKENCQAYCLKKENNKLKKK